MKKRKISWSSTKLVLVLLAFIALQTAVSWWGFSNKGIFVGQCILLGTAILLSVWRLRYV